MSKKTKIMILFAVIAVGLFGIFAAPTVGDLIMALQAPRMPYSILVGPQPKAQMHTHVPVFIYAGRRLENGELSLTDLNPSVKEHLIEHLHIFPKVAGRWEGGFGQPIYFYIPDDKPGWEYGKVYEISLGRTLRFKQTSNGQELSYVLEHFKTSFQLPEPKVWLEKESFLFPRPQGVDNGENYNGEYQIRSNYKFKSGVLAQNLNILGPAPEQIPHKGKFTASGTAVSIVDLDTRPGWTLRIEAAPIFGEGIPFAGISLPIQTLTEQELKDMRAAK